MSSQCIQRGLSSIAASNYQRAEDSALLGIVMSTKSTRSDWLKAAAEIVSHPEPSLRQLEDLDLFERALFHLKLTRGEVALQAYQILLNAPQLSLLDPIQIDALNLSEDLLYLMRPDPNNATHEEFKERTELFYQTGPGAKVREALFSASRTASGVKTWI